MNSLPRTTRLLAFTKILPLLLVLLANLFIMAPTSAQIAPPQLSMQYVPSTIFYNGLTTQTFVLSNPNPGTTLTGVAFTDSVPFFFVIESPSDLTISCTGGSSGTFAASSNGDAVALTGGTLTGGSSCTMSVSLRAINIASGANSTSFVTSTNASPGNPALASFVIVPAPPTVTKSFGAPAIPLNGTTTLTFNVINPNPAANLDPGFTDVLPSGLLLADPLGVVNDTCGGYGATPGGNVILFARNFRLSSCAFTVNVVGVESGIQNNVTSVVSYTGGSSAPATATIEVAGPPTIAKSFDVPSIPVNGTASLTFALANPNTAIALSGIAFSDTFPSGMRVANPNGLTGACGGGSIVAVAGSNSVSLAAATLAANTSCTFSLRVTLTTEGTYTNVTSAVTSTEGGSGGFASASLVGFLIATPVPTVQGWKLAVLVVFVGVSTVMFAFRKPLFQKWRD
jgi:hypothetical protein